MIEELLTCRTYNGLKKVKCNDTACDYYINYIRR